MWCNIVTQKFQFLFPWKNELECRCFSFGTERWFKYKASFYILVKLRSSPARGSFSCEPTMHLRNFVDVIGSNFLLPLLELSVHINKQVNQKVSMWDLCSHSFGDAVACYRRTPLRDEKMYRSCSMLHLRSSQHLPQKIQHVCVAKDWLEEQLCDQTVA